MAVKIIDGKKIHEIIKQELAIEVARLVNETKKRPGLAVVLIGEDPASQVYVSHKRKACLETGIESFEYFLPKDASEKEVLELINELNNRRDVNGILVQLPLPKQINSREIILAIDPKKDVDGFHPISVGNLLTKEITYVPCTAAGIVQLLKRYDIKIEGKHCVVVGASSLVGKPTAILLLQKNGTVTICHEYTQFLDHYTRQADILVVAVGKQNLITADMVKEGAVVIDVGINKLSNGKIVGDVDFEKVKEAAAFITPVPGGVGPMTIAMLMKNCVKAFKIQNGVSLE